MISNLDFRRHYLIVKINNFNFTLTFFKYNFSKDESSGSSDMWAMMVANISHSYTIEVGPLNHERKLFMANNGFFVKLEFIEYVTERVYKGIREYLRSFIEKLTEKAEREINDTCGSNFEIIKKYTGHWSRK